MPKASILIVEDYLFTAQTMKMLLQKLEYTIISIAVSGEESIKKAEEEKPDLVLMDIGLEGDMDGIEAAKEIYHRFHIPVIYITAYGDSHTMERAERTKHYGYLTKPYTFSQLNNSIQTALYQHALEKKIEK